MTRRENAQHRRPSRRRSRPLILVVCGAERTEPQYFAGLRDSLNSRAVDIVINLQSKAPAQVVEHAAAFARHSPRDFDEIWCVVDVDEFDLDSTIRTARRSGIKLAVSNPCFELWLLLHHEDCRTSLPGFKSALGRLQKYVPNYDKARLDFAFFTSGVPKAVIRAKALDPSGIQYKRNPSTGMWRLVEKMTEFQ